MSATLAPSAQQTNNLTIDDEPFATIHMTLLDEEDESTARAIILPILSSEPVVHAHPITKYNLVEMMLINGSVSDSMKLFLWDTIKDSPIFQPCIDGCGNDLVISSSLSSPFPIFKDLYFRWKSQSDDYKMALKCKRLSGRDEEHRQLIEHEKQVLDQLEPEFGVYNN